MTTQALSIEPIGVVRTPYPEKFAVPRQPGLVSADNSWVALHPPYAHPDWCRELEGFSHLWLLSWFHEIPKGHARPLVRPPRLGGRTKVGVFASRSPFRPNPIGLSVVVLRGISHEHGQMRIHIAGADLVDGTPIIDIKPYIPYADSLPEASGHFAASPPNKAISVKFSTAAATFISENDDQEPDLKALIEQVLQQSPQPAWDTTLHKTYGMSLYGLNIRWRVSAENEVEVTQITQR